MNAFYYSWFLALLLSFFFLAFVGKFIWEDYKRAKLKEEELKKAKPN